MREHITPILGALAVVGLYAIAGTWDAASPSPALQDAQQQAQQEQRYQIAAAAIDATEMKAARRCNEAHPGGAALVWSHRGEAVCVPRPLP